MNLDRLYIIPCSDEISKTGLDTENSSIRSTSCSSKTDKVVVNLSASQNVKTRGKCSKKSNDDPLCTYNGSMVFIDGKYHSCTTEKFWTQYVSFINNSKIEGKLIFSCHTSQSIKRNYSRTNYG